ncbi:hypothetical protein PsYK624_007250 [Phanerochaete sordida]|uniref:Uncharacterized protein n=1 Tax=Phanerochaete sordida TaxID=48140 RepID=A0A9P3FYT9_9APHY|nr:hypothetical protein PsYK624_007250 [Phanerochaete sordida]
MGEHGATVGREGLRRTFDGPQTPRGGSSAPICTQVLPRTNPNAKASIANSEIFDREQMRNPAASASHRGAGAEIGRSLLRKPVHWTGRPWSSPSLMRCVHDDLTWTTDRASTHAAASHSTIPYCIVTSIGIQSHKVMPNI